MAADNSTKKQAEDSNKPESLVASFHRAKSLIPVDQDLKTIPPEMPVSEALRLMQKHHFSQVPVVAGQAVLGVFSYRSFSTKAVAKQKSAKYALGELPVEDFLEDLHYAHATDDWNLVLQNLDRYDAILVGHRNRLEGMITTIDMLDYFQEIANPFITIAEIELSLRQIIQTCIGRALPEAIRISLKTAYEEEDIPTELNEMTFDNYVQIINNKENWHYFEQMFGSQERARKQTFHKLDQLGKWRNTVFHFRRRLQNWELETLAEYREWLHRRVRAFEGRRTAKAAQAKQDKPKQAKTNRQKVLTASEPAAAEFFAWMLDHAKVRRLKVYWGTKGFSIRKKLPHRMASFAYGYPPQTFEFYFNNLDLSEEEEAKWRDDLLSFGLLEEAGTKTLRCIISETNVEELRQLFNHIVTKIEKHAHE